MKKLYLLLTGLIIVTSVVQAQKIDRSKFISDSLDNYINRALTNWRIPGAAAEILASLPVTGFDLWKTTDPTLLPPCPKRPKPLRPLGYRGTGINLMKPCFRNWFEISEHGRKRIAALNLPLSSYSVCFFWIAVTWVRWRWKVFQQPAQRQYSS